MAEDTHKKFDCIRFVREVRAEPLRLNNATHVAIACIGKVAAFVIWRRIQPLAHT